MAKQLPPNFAKLTDWETGEVIYVDRTQIVSCRRLNAEVHKPLWKGDVAMELGARTRVDTRTDMLLVRETAEQVMGLED